MKNNLLNEEINRIQELLGVTKININEDIINESILSSEAAKFITDILGVVDRKVVTATGKTYAVRTAKIAVNKIGKAELTDIDKSIIKALTSEAIKADTKLLSRLSSEIVSEIGNLASPKAKIMFRNSIETELAELLGKNEMGTLTRSIDKKIAGVAGNAAGNLTGNVVTTSAEKAFIDVDKYIKKMFPKVYDNKVVIDAVSQEYAKEIEKMGATDAITYLNSELSRLDKQLKQIANDDIVQKNLKLKEQIEKIIETTKPIRQYLANHTYKGGVWKIVKRIGALLAFYGAMDTFVGGYYEAKNGRKNLFKTLTVRAGRNLGALLSIFGITAFNISFSPDSDNYSIFDNNDDATNSTQTGYTNNLDGYKKYLEANRIDSTKAVDLGGGKFKQDPTLDDNFIQIFKNGNFE